MYIVFWSNIFKSLTSGAQNSNIITKKYNTPTVQVTSRHLYLTKNIIEADILTGRSGWTWDIFTKNTKYSQIICWYDSGG